MVGRRGATSRRPWAPSKNVSTTCLLCGAGAYCCSAVTRLVASPPPSLGVSSLDLGRLHRRRPFFVHAPTRSGGGRGRLGVDAIRPPLDKAGAPQAATPPTGQPPQRCRRPPRQN